MIPRLTDEEIKDIAKAIAEAHLQAMSDPKTVSAIVGVWETYIDKQIGKGVRKLASVIILTLLGIATWKLSLIQKWLEPFFKP